MALVASWSDCLPPEIICTICVVVLRFLNCTYYTFDRLTCLHFRLDHLQILLEFVHVGFRCRPNNTKSFLLIWFRYLNLIR